MESYINDNRNRNSLGIEPTRENTKVEFVDCDTAKKVPIGHPGNQVSGGTVFQNMGGFYWNLGGFELNISFSVSFGPFSASIDGGNTDSSSRYINISSSQIGRPVKLYLYNIKTCKYLSMLYIKPMIIRIGTLLDILMLYRVL